MRADKLLALSALLALSHSAVAESEPFVEKNGILMVEVESEPATGQWSLEDSIDGFTGTGYYLWNGPNHLGGPSGNDDSHITYRFRITTPGNYELRWRSRIHKGDNPTEHNDSWIRFPGGRNIIGEEPLNGWTKVYMSQLNTWSWDAYTVDGQAQSVRQYFDVGDHTMQISGRSNGHAIDRIALYQYDNVNFSSNKFSTMTPSARSDATGAEHSQLANTCSDGILSLSPLTAATLVDQSDVLPSELSMAGEQRIAMLQYDLSHVPSIVQDASMMLIREPAGTVSSTSVSVYLGSHAQWQADDDAQAMPYAASMLGADVLSPDAGAGSRIRLDHQQFNRDTQSLLLISDNASEDIRLEAELLSRAPRLEFTLSNRQACFTAPVTDLSDLGQEEAVLVTPPGTPNETVDQSADQNENSVSDNQAQDSQEQTNPSTADTPENTVSDQTTGDGVDSTNTTPAENTMDTTAAGQSMENDETTSSQASSKRRFGGSLSYWLVCLMSLLTIVRYRLRYKTREKRSRDF